MPTDPSDPEQRKRELRRRLLAARRGRAGHEQEDLDTRVRATLATWLRTVRPATVAAYVPMPGEPGGPSMPDTLAEDVPEVLLPVVLPDRDLDWAAYRPGSGLAPAALGLREPVGPRLGPDAISRAAIVIVPALAVDRHGTRLGRGGGSYDRALARVARPQVVVAALHPDEIVDSLPAQPHDRPVDGVVTPDGLVLLSI